MFSGGEGVAGGWRGGASLWDGSRAAGGRGTEVCQQDVGGREPPGILDGGEAGRERR